MKAASLDRHARLDRASRGPHWRAGMATRGEGRLDPRLRGGDVDIRLLLCLSALVNHARVEMSRARRVQPLAPRQLESRLGRHLGWADRLLSSCREIMPEGGDSMPQRGSSPLREQSVDVPAGPVTLKGILAVPRNAVGVVIFAHGSGSGRFSPRNNYVARVLQEGGIATLLIDLLTEREAEDRRLVFDIDLLTERVLHATAWLSSHPETRGLPIGYFGASTGAAAALKAAAREGSEVAAVVSRGGRPDLAMEQLPQVEAPTLLIVGGEDEPVVELNQTAYALLRCQKRLVIVPGATHLFEEPGALEEVARTARDWFQMYLPQVKKRAA